MKGYDANASWAVYYIEKEKNARLEFSWKEPVTIEWIVFHERYHGNGACWESYEVFLDDDLEPIAQGQWLGPPGPHAICLDKPSRAIRLTFKLSPKFNKSCPGAAEVLIYAERPSWD